MNINIDDLSLEEIRSEFLEKSFPFMCGSAIDHIEKFMLAAKSNMISDFDAELFDTLTLCANEFKYLGDTTVTLRALEDDLDEMSEHYDKFAKSICRKKIDDFNHFAIIVLENCERSISILECEIKYADHKRVEVLQARIDDLNETLVKKFNELLIYT